MKKNNWISKTLNSGKVIATLTLAVAGFVIAVTPVSAGVSGSAGPTYPSIMNVGNTNIPTSIQITNNSTSPQNTETVLVTNIFHTPSCGSDVSSICSLADADPGVFEITGAVTGRTGTGCAGTTFSVSSPDVVTGEVQFTPNTPVILASSLVDGPAATCIIDFNVNVLKAPTKDASVVSSIQTAQLARVRFIAQSTGVEGSASGSSQVTITKASPTVTTIPSAGGSVGTVLNDTATLSGGLAPTGAVTFKLFSPTDSTCIGTPAYTDTDTTAPYATNPGFVSNSAGVWHWSADYAGDANNNATSSPCSAEPVTVIAKGRIIVDKITNPSGDTQSFAFTATGTGYTGFSLTDVAAPNNQELDAGTYSVSEGAISGWTQTSATCVSSNQDVEIPGNINLQAGETVTCTFTNTKAGHLIVQKTTLPAGDTTVFTINATGTGVITGAATSTVTDALDKNYEVTAGTYSVIETVPAGWTQTSNTCSSVVVAAGQTVTCLITNTKNGQIIIVKDAVPNNAQDFLFTNNFGNGNSSTFSLDDDTDSVLSNMKDSEVLTGTYAVSESAVAGWTQTSAICSDGSPINAIIVSAGETVTCTFTNTLQTGNIIVVKDAVPNDAQNFTFTNNFANGNPASFDLDDDSDGTLLNTRNSEVLAGTFNVSETAVAGWTQTSATCSDGSPVSAVIVSAGETVTCTFTNTKAGHLIVQKTTLPAGDTTVFTINATGTGTITGSSAGTITDATDKDYEVIAGTYSVSEAVPAGWTKTGDTCQNVVVAAGQTVTCLITNTKNGQIIIVKDAVPNNAQDFLFTNNFANGNSSTFNLDDDSDSVLSNTKNSEVLAGTYSISEGAVAGWTQTSAICSDSSPINAILVSPGETVTCTFINTLQKGRIIVDKITNPSGDTQSFAFTATGTGYTGFSLTDVAAPNNQELDAGTYSVAETSLSGWTQTSATCASSNQDVETPGNISLQPGETVTCTFTNTKKGTISGMKFNDLNGNGIKDSSELGLAGWTISLSNGSTTTTNSLGNYSFTNLAPGSFTVSETQKTGWTQTYPVAPGTHIVAIDAGENEVNIDFGNMLIPVQGCSPGYWKQPQHFGSYPTGIYPNTLFSEVFGGTAFPGMTLLEVLSTGGGGQIALGRIMVGAYLNASTVTGYPYTPAEVIAAFNSATAATYDSVKATFEALQDPCPFGRNPGPAYEGGPVADKPGKSGNKGQIN